MNIKNTKTVLAGVALTVLLAGCGAKFIANAQPSVPDAIFFSAPARLQALFVYEDILCCFDGEAYYYLTTEGAPLTPDAYDIAYPFHEGLACACKNGKYGYIDTEGSTAIPFDLDDAAPFSEGLAYFAKGEQYGFMDKTGTPLFYLDCDSVSAFHEGLAYIFVDGKYGYIDETGNIAIAPAFDDADYFENGCAIVMQDCKYGVIDQDGHFLIAPDYEKITAENHCFIAQKGEMQDIFDSQGNIAPENACESDDSAKVLLIEGNIPPDFYPENYVPIYSFAHWSLYDDETKTHYLLKKIEEEKPETLKTAHLFLKNHITPKTPAYMEFLKNGVFPYEAVNGEQEESFTELYAYDKTCKFLSLGKNHEPMLYFHAEPFERLGFGHSLSYSGFLVLWDKEVICPLSGHECGGSAGGSIACIWYDREENAIFPGTLGGLGEDSSARCIYDYEKGNVSPRAILKIRYTDSGVEYSVNDEPATAENYEKRKNRYERLSPL